jgi:hypothetical protein
MLIVRKQGGNKEVFMTSQRMLENNIGLGPTKWELELLTFFLREGNLGF